MGAAETYIGTSNYMAPERMTSEAYAGPSDIWGLGLVYWELFTGQKAFAHAQSSIVDLYDAIVGTIFLLYKSSILDLIHFLKFWSKKCSKLMF